MALQVFLSHTGKKLSLDLDSCRSLEDLKEWVSQHSAIRSEDQILMTGKGKQVKDDSLSPEVEIFVYDRRILASTSSRTADRDTISSTSLPTIPDAPLTLKKDDTLQAWQKLFAQRRRWAHEVANVAADISQHLRDRDGEREVMRRGVAIALSNMTQHTVNLKPKYEETKAWADEVLDDQHYLLENWQGSVAYYKAIPVITVLGKCVRTGTTVSTQNRTATFQDLINQSKLKDLAMYGQDKHRQLSEKMSAITTTFERIQDASREMTDEFHSSTSLSDSESSYRIDQAMEEIEVLTKKMDADCNTIEALSEGPKTVMQAQKTASLHDNTFMTSLIQTDEELRLLHVKVQKVHVEASIAALKFLQSVSEAESSIGSVHQKLASLYMAEEASRVFQTLNGVVRLPFLYGSVLIEYIRRHEWSQRRSTSTEDDDAYRADESRRRQAWSKDLGTMVDISHLDSISPGLEVGREFRDEHSLEITRETLINLYSSLEKAGFKDVVSDLKEIAKCLDRTPKSQVRRNRAFKNGSLHEAADNDASLPLRGDHQGLEVLRKEKVRAEDKLKSAESRIRKLEDLLHRQSQGSRPNSMAGFGISASPSFERQTEPAGSNFQSALSKAVDARPASLSSRRTSFNQDADGKAFAQRIVSLETDLGARRIQVKELEKALATRSNAEDMLKEQVREAISTKEDLLSNFEAQQKEFDDERRLMNERNKKLKVRLEELEDELDVLASRENEFRVQALEHDLATARQEADLEIRKAHEQANAARQDHRAEQDVAAGLRAEVDKQKEDITCRETTNNELRVQLEASNQTEKEHQKVLASLLTQLSRPGETAEGTAAMLGNVGKAIQATLARQLEQNTNIDRMSSVITELESTNTSKDVELDRLKSQILTNGSEADGLRDQLGQHNDKFTTLEKEMASRGADHEFQIEKLTSKLEDKRSELSSLQGSYVRLDSHRGDQATRADDISQRLYVQNCKLQRLLEQLNFSVTKQDGNMTVQRISSKSNTASAVLGDTSVSMRRSSSGQLLSKEEAEAAIDAKVLHWATSENHEDMSRMHEQFMQSISDFDVDVFYDAIYRRLKDVEHVARKSQRDARAYRDKARHAQGEAHERLSLRAFKEGDLALFLPTKDQATKPWAAFNVGAPHYFLREQESHKLSKRDWMIARISKVEERVVDLTKSVSNSLRPAPIAGGAAGGSSSIDDENPYELSDGLRWYLLDAAEEKPGAPISVGSAKTTVAAVNVDAKGSTVRIKRADDGNAATKTLSRSLDSRRSSSTSKKGFMTKDMGAPLATEATANAVSSSLTVPNNETTVDGRLGAQDQIGTLSPQKDGSKQTENPSASISPSKSLRTTASVTIPEPDATSSQASTSKGRQKTSKGWDALWSLDLSLEGGKGKK